MDPQRQRKGKNTKAGGSRNRDEQARTQPNPPTGFIDLLTQNTYNPYNFSFNQPPNFFENQPQFYNPPQFQSPPQFQHSTQQYRKQESSEEETYRNDDWNNTQNVVSDEESSDPPPTNKKGKAVETVQPSGKVKAKVWTEEEEVALAQAWVALSEQPNEQRRESFWKAILEHFTAQLGGTERSTHQLNSKQKDLFKKINWFNCIFNRRLSARHSGESEKDVFTASLAEYRKEHNKKGFPHVRAWQAVRNHIKWTPVPSMEDDINIQLHASKRTKTAGSNTYTTSSDAKYPNININLEDDNEDPNWNEPDDEDVFREPERPTRKGKRQASSSGDPNLVNAVTEFSSHMRERNTKLDEIKIAKNKAAQAVYEEQRELLISTRRSKDLKFISTPIDDDLPESIKRAILNQKQEIAKRWGWE